MMKNFKLLVAGFLVILSVTRATRADIRKECRKQTGVSWAALKKLKSGDFNQADHKLKCYLRCFMMKNGIIRSDDQVDVENAIRHLPPNLQESSRKALFKCKNSSSKNGCDKAYEIVRCYFKSQPEILRSVSFV
ncbi:general odorant-binding protein 56d-like isoform X5 [Venturia canescens]|uniref:general odorant-binding protein 56d-like isoform X5 n=1 Tax=Venturia canescens TaxID=32260 RepID=UPI001C9BEB88|nr:general odorant-binding protein 56d-like isoform X5 [Venturia canescens]